MQGVGYTVFTAANGAEALHFFESGTCDLVVADLAMPEMPGEELAAALRKIAANIPVILCSGTGVDQHITATDQVELTGKVEGISGVQIGLAKTAPVGGAGKFEGYKTRRAVARAPRVESPVAAHPGHGHRGSFECH